MDLGDKLKFYQSNTDKQKRINSRFQNSHCIELNGEPLKPDVSSPIKIEQYIPYEYLWCQKYNNTLVDNNVMRDGIKRLTKLICLKCKKVIKVE